MTIHTYIRIISSATSDTLFCITQHARYIPIIVCACGKREVRIDWPMVRSAKAAPVNGTKLSSGLLPQCRRTLGSERHRDEVVRPDELGTVAMACGGINTPSLCFHLLMA